MTVEQVPSMKRKPGLRPGLSSENGKLYIISEAREIVVRGWPEMSAWTKTYRNPLWSQFRPALDLNEGLISATRTLHRFQPEQHINSIACNQPAQEAEMEFLGKMDDNAAPEHVEGKKGLDEFWKKLTGIVHAYFSNVPQGIRKSVQLYPWRHWHLLAMSARCPESVDLMATNPALAYCLASCGMFSQTPSKHTVKFMRRWSGSRRRDICGALGFPQSEYSVNILSKITASSCATPWLKSVRDLLKEPKWCKLLSHLPSIPPGVMYVLGNKQLRHRATPRFLYELASAVSPDCYFALANLVDLEKEAGVFPAKRIHSLLQLDRYHDDLLFRAYCRDDSKKLDISHFQFPRPPIPGTKMIVPLETPESIDEEGCVQNNCVAIYAEEIAKGSVYFYRVLNPERATLAVHQNETGCWHLGDLLAAGNEHVSEETRATVFRWFEHEYHRQLLFEGII